MDCWNSLGGNQVCWIFKSIMQMQMFWLPTQGKIHMTAFYINRNSNCRLNIWFISQYQVPYYRYENHQIQVRLPWGYLYNWHYVISSYLNRSNLNIYISFQSSIILFKWYILVNTYEGCFYSWILSNTRPPITSITSELSDFTKCSIKIS